MSCHSNVNIHITKNASESKTHTQARIKLKVSIVNSIGCLSYVYSITCDLYRAIKRLSSIDGLNQIESARPVKKEGGRTLQLSGAKLYAFHPHYTLEFGERFHPHKYGNQSALHYVCRSPYKNLPSH